uniref:G_PROTEIN_RECEP_F1_2 domain-containing protein n=1 Tax=Globodera pallida TaxID=36090 RepID=A0A183C2X3_GLOPA
MPNSKETVIMIAQQNATTTEYAYPSLVFPMGTVTVLAFLANIVLAGYIVWRRLYRNFISSQFIVHLCLTNIVGLSVLVPLFFVNLWSGTNIWENNHLMCRMQTFLMCSVWTVVHFMRLCIAGVHLLTFARIHYAQLFGLPPFSLCALAWLAAFAVALPSLTNSHIVVYDPALHHCVWGSTDYSYKFLAYMLILCVLIPSILSYYCYIKVLKILYHSPLVFQSIGLYKSRFLVYAFLLGGAPFCACSSATPRQLRPPFLYGISLFQMKEEDMALTARAHKTLAPFPHHQLHHQQQNNSSSGGGQNL